MSKNVILTGASSGIGLALGRELARRGYRVALCARRRDLLDQAAAELRQNGFEAMALACDVTDRNSVSEAVRQVEQAWGGVDLAIANAGIDLPTSLENFELERAEAVMHVNFNGMLYLFDAVIPSMIARRNGRFVGVASLAGLRGLPTSAAYSASKGAMQLFLESARVELAQHDVGTTIINPGFVKTAMTEKNDFHMPFLMDADTAARLMADRLERGWRVIDFPLPTSLAMRFARLLPVFLYDLVAAVMLRQAQPAKKNKVAG